MIDPQLMKPLDHFTGASFLKVTIKSFALLAPGAIALYSAHGSCQSSCVLDSPGMSLM